MRFHDFKWHTHIGTGYTSTSGIDSGGVWITKGMIVGFISQQSNLVCRPNTTVKTYFQYKYIQTNIDCIVSRSEERRVGKECRCKWSRYDYKEKTEMNIIIYTVEVATKGAC